MKILITGASGYVGNALIEDLKGKHEIIAAGRDVSRIPNVGVEKVTLDITSVGQACAVIEAVQPDVVIHAAALPKRSTLDDITFIRTNVEGAKNIAEAVKNHSNAKFIMLSSGCAFKQIPGQAVTADSERETGTSFSKSKNIAEQDVAQIFEGAEGRLALVYPPVILHAAQEKGVIPYSLHDAKSSGAMTNRLPGGHVNFITHSKFAELMEAIAEDTRPDLGVQRYFITGTRFTTEDFFQKLQGIFNASGVSASMRTEADPHVETMCVMDESAIQAVKPGFDWGGIDQTVSEIVQQNLTARTLNLRTILSQTPQLRMPGG